MGDDQRRETDADILAFWERERIFEQTVERDAPAGDFTFYEGPPTANAPPGIHHVEARTFKDIIPRYKTMRGYRVRRKAGWDTHGLPVELQIEKKLGLKTKRDIEAYGVATFNAACRDSVWEFKKEWERLTDRIGFWLDQHDPYVTYEMSYVESVWWFLQQAWEKKLLARDYKIVPWCPRCETPLSSHEVAQGYEDNVEDPSVIVKCVLTNEHAARLRVPEGTAFLVWTTTPWTLPGNGALAVHPEVEYAVVRTPTTSSFRPSPRRVEKAPAGDLSTALRSAQDDEYFVIAKPLVARVLGEGAVIERTIMGKELVGLRYQPLYSRIDIAAYPEAYQVLDADFVSMEDGTGIVHIAPAYGEEDFAFKARGIPPTFSVNEKGIMADGLPGAGKFAKQADADVRADLQARGLLFRDEMIRHTYPFCWRCKTPLLYYARRAWYITMSKLREEIQAKNRTIAWHPEHLKDGRFGEWLRELKDWAITRERYWGTPLPIWECDRCQHREMIGSFADLITKAPKRNRYLLMRHGEAESNATNTISARVETSAKYPLTAAGRTRVAAAAKRLQDAGITKIIASPFARMHETAEIVADTIGYAKDAIVYDDRLREIDLPDFDGKPVEEHHAYFANDLEKFTKKIGMNETWGELAVRMLATLKEIDAQHEGETILICSHGDPLSLLQWAYSGRTREGIAAMPYPQVDDPHPFVFTGALVNDRGELDVHRPFVDAITWACTRAGCAGTMQRFPEVVDVWMDSGCMPFAQWHYPFELPPEGMFRSASAASDDASGGKGSARPRARSEQATRLEGKGPWENREVVPRSADYISEAIDQTRGWFYTLLAVATVLGWDAPYRNVISLGHLLDAKGQKMSKSKGNVVDPWTVLERYGADVVRWYMVAINQPWDPKLFDETDLKRIAGKPFGTLKNVVSFWELHGGNASAAWTSDHLLDRWLRARVAAVHAEVTQYLDAYAITEGARAIGDLVDDVSTWWLRRSRERLKDGDAGACGTFTATLRSLAVLLAPFAPFTAERVWMALRRAAGGTALPLSVHLAEWGESKEQTFHEGQMLLLVSEMRRLCSRALEARARVGIPIRQVLTRLKIKMNLDPTEFASALSMIAEEVNVKEVIPDLTITDEIDLDTTITPALKREGMIRELSRAVNNFRKEMGLTPSDRIRVTYACDDVALVAAITEHRDQLLRGTNADAWEAGGAAAGHAINVSGTAITLTVVKS